MQSKRRDSFVSVAILLTFAAGAAMAVTPPWVFVGDSNRLIGDPRRGTDENYTNTIPGPPLIQYYTPADLKNGTAPVNGPLAGQFESLRVGSGGTLGINLPQPMKVPGTDPRAGIPDPFAPVGAATGNPPNVPPGADYWGVRAGAAVQWQTNQDGGSVLLVPLGSVSSQAFSLTPRNLFTVVVGLNPSGVLTAATPVNDGLAPGSAVEVGPPANVISDFVPWLRNVSDPNTLVTGYGITTWDTATVTASLAFLTAGLDETPGTGDDIPAAVVAAALIGRVNLWEGGGLFDPVAGGVPPGNFNELNFNFAGGTYGMAGDGLNDAVDGVLLLTGTLENVQISNTWTAALLDVVDPDGVPDSGDEFFVAEPGTVRRTIKVVGDIIWDGGSLLGFLSSTGGVFSVNYNDIPFANTTGADSDTAYDFIGDTITSYDASMTFEASAPGLEVTKTCEPSFTRTWKWRIDKTCKPPAVVLDPGQTTQAEFEATVCPDGYTDSDFKVTGEICIHNPTSSDATVESIEDIVSPDIAATVTCVPALPFVVPAGQTVCCDYEASLPDGSTRTNTATVTTSGPVAGGTAECIVDFANAIITEVDECVDVSDDKAGPLGSVCADEGCKTFNYSLTLGPYTKCGPVKFTNTASFVTNDTQTTGSSSCSIDITVRCPPVTSCPGVLTVCPAYRTLCPVIETQCPSRLTRCPTKRTCCPVVETQCPCCSTKCPALNTSCPASVTTCPPAKTWCPAVETQCPPCKTKCPTKETSCPAVQTQCPPCQTKCPAKETSCPAVRTQCPLVLTLCPTRETLCPETYTKCPAYETNCPAVQTRCPTKATCCPVVTSK